MMSSCSAAETSVVGRHVDTNKVEWLASVDIICLRMSHIDIAVGYLVISPYCEKASFLCRNSVFSHDYCYIDMVLGVANTKLFE